MPTGPEPGSLPSQIAELPKGASIVRAVRCRLDSLTRAAVAAGRKKLSNAATSAIGRAKKRAPGRDFDMELGQFLTRKDDLVLCLVITRTK